MGIEIYDDTVRKRREGEVRELLQRLRDVMEILRNAGLRDTPEFQTLSDDSAFLMDGYVTASDGEFQGRLRQIEEHIQAAHEAHKKFKEGPPVQEASSGGGSSSPAGGNGGDKKGEDMSRERGGTVRKEQLRPRVEALVTFDEEFRALEVIFSSAESDEALTEFENLLKAGEEHRKIVEAFDALLPAIEAFTVREDSFDPIRAFWQTEADRIKEKRALTPNIIAINCAHPGSFEGKNQERRQELKRLQKRITKEEQILSTTLRNDVISYWNSVTNPERRTLIQRAWNLLYPNYSGPLSVSEQINEAHRLLQEVQIAEQQTRTTASENPDQFFQEFERRVRAGEMTTEREIYTYLVGNTQIREELLDYKRSEKTHLAYFANQMTQREREERGRPKGEANYNITKVLGLVVRVRDVTQRIVQEYDHSEKFCDTHRLNLEIDTRWSNKLISNIGADLLTPFKGRLLELRKLLETQKNWGAENSLYGIVRLNLDVLDTVEQTRTPQEREPRREPSQPAEPPRPASASEPAQSRGARGVAEPEEEPDWAEPPAMYPRRRSRRDFLRMGLFGGVAAAGVYGGKKILDEIFRKEPEVRPRQPVSRQRIQESTPEVTTPSEQPEFQDDGPRAFREFDGPEHPRFKKQATLIRKIQQTGLPFDTLRFQEGEENKNNVLGMTPEGNIAFRVDEGIIIEWMGVPLRRFRSLGESSPTVGEEIIKDVLNKHGVTPTAINRDKDGNIGILFGEKEFLFINSEGSVLFVNYQRLPGIGIPLNDRGLTDTINKSPEKQYQSLPLPVEQLWSSLLWEENKPTLAGTTRQLRIFHNYESMTEEIPENKEIRYDVWYRGLLISRDASVRRIKIEFPNKKSLSAAFKRNGNPYDVLRFGSFELGRHTEFRAIKSTDYPTGEYTISWEIQHHDERISTETQAVRLTVTR